MRENRTYGSEGGERLALPYPYPAIVRIVEDRDQEIYR